MAVRLAGLPAGDERFSPHLTLARLGRTVEPEQRRTVAETVRALPPPPTMPFTAHAAVLTRSVLGGQQPRHTIVQRFT